MIFLRYEGFRSYLKLYPITVAILAINIALFVYDFWLGGDHYFIQKGILLVDPFTNYFSFDEPWRYVTSIFLHGGFDHLLFNCFAILVFAPPLERILGKFNYAFFYLFAGLMGNAFTALLETDSISSLGASGAIYGVYGIYLYLALFKKAMDEGSRRTVYTILIFGIIASLLSPNTNLWAHLGGAVAGFGFGFLYDKVLNTRK
ncbi:rhomboid family intramembrane serine protease [Paenibacillus xanthanilyticus]|uniref:Rhomboid family intramembrane serine protease n=1 Tax=Paenibacillus xanthanilyticus TaxID=1783531 RepID=A0ABV8K9N9_9BACL